MRGLAKAPSAAPTVRFGSRWAEFSTLFVLLLAFASVFSVSSATAETDNYVETGSFGQANPGAGPGAFEEPRRVAVYGVTGEIFVVDRGNDRVQVFAPTAISGTYETEFGAGILDEPFGIAIDQGDGDVYVTSAGNGEIVKFTRGVGQPPTFAVDPGFTSPAQGEGVGQVGSFASAIALDPSDGSLWVGDSGRSLVQHFSADGASFLGAFDGATSPNQPGGPTFAGLSDLALDSAGNVIVAHGTTVERFGPGGGYQLALGTEFFAGFAGGVALAVEPGTDRILVAYGYGGAKIELYADEALVTTLASAAFGWAGLAIDPSAPNHLYAVSNQLFGCCGSNGVTVLRPATRPAVTVDPPANVEPTNARLTGTVDPRGTETTWHFEYSPDAGVSWFSAPVPAPSAGSGNGPVAVVVDLAGLAPSTSYLFRLIAGSTEGVVSVDGPEFVTPPGPPLAETLAAGPVGETQARLNGRLNPYGLGTSYYFEYGPDSSYGQKSPASGEMEAGSANADVNVSRELTGLAPGTTLHYRVVATNSKGTSIGPDRVLVTRVAGSGPVNRGIELVNAPEKGNQIASVRGPSVISADGNRILWQTSAGGPGTSTGAQNTFLAVRTADGWRSESLLPPVDRLVDHGESSYRLIKATSNFDHFLFEVTSGIFSSLPRKLVVMDLGRNQRVSPPIDVSEVTGRYSYFDDLSHIYTFSTTPFDPSQATGTTNVYDFGGPAPELVSKMPDGNAPACGVNPEGFAANENPWSSKQGPPRVFFRTPGSDCSAAPQLYMRDQDAGTTTLLSGPALPGGQDGPATFYRASPDGSQIVFASTRRLTEDDKNSTNDLYRYTVGQGKECLTCFLPQANVSQGGAAPVSKDLTRVYFSSSSQLVPGRGVPGSNNLYLLEGGKLHFVAKGLSINGGYDYTVTSDGRYLFFGSSEPGLTSDDTSGFNELYRYDAVEHGVECLSCPGNRPATAGALGQPGRDQSSLGGPSTVSADGNTFVFTTAEPLDPRDVNQQGDIYEWRNGRTKLITDGVTKFPPDNSNGSLSLIGLDPSATNVLFQVGVNLTGYERDGAGQLYSARLGGGFPPPPPPAAPCVEDACQGPLSAPPPVSAPATAQVVGPGNARAKQNKARAKQKRKQRKQQKKRAQKQRKHHQRATGKARG